MIRFLIIFKERIIDIAFSVICKLYRINDEKYYKSVIKIEKTIQENYVAIGVCIICIVICDFSRLKKSIQLERIDL